MAAACASAPLGRQQRKAVKEGAHGTMYLPSGEQYKGEWADNKRHGRGVVTYANGDKYEGDWAGGARHGSGTLWVLRNGKYHVRYSGEWCHNLPEGQGLSYDEAGNSYEGGWLAGLKHGRGRATTGGRPGDGFGADVYEGGWQHDLRHGSGTLMLANGDMYEGEWASDMKHGRGTYFFFAKGRRFDGVWVEGTARAGEYAEVQPAAPGMPGSLPAVELAAPEAVLSAAVAELAQGAQGCVC